MLTGAISLPQTRSIRILLSAATCLPSHTLMQREREERDSKLKKYFNSCTFWELYFSSTFNKAN